MSEPVLGSDENPLDEALIDAIVQFTGCIGNALDNLCSYGWTIGETYVPFNPDEEDDCDAEEAMCSQAWVRVMGVQPMAVPDSFEGNTCALTLRFDLEVGIIRCTEIVEEGEAPTATDVLVAAAQAMADMRAILCAALGCEVWDALDVGAWTPIGPLGGQYGGIWQFTAERS